MGPSPISRESPGTHVGLNQTDQSESEEKWDPFDTGSYATVSVWNRPFRMYMMQYVRI